MTDVFISYKREERSRVERFAAVLNALKLEVWFDARLESGVHFDAEIAQELARTKAILVLWSPAAYGSEWVRGEAMKGLERKVLAAAFVEPTDLYPPFNTVHAENLTPFLANGSRDTWDDPGLLRLLDRIGTLTGRRGLAGFARARATGTFEALKAWAAANIGDPLEQDAWDLAQDREIALARKRVQQARDAAHGVVPAPAQSAATTPVHRTVSPSTGWRDPAPTGHARAEAQKSDPTWIGVAVGGVVVVLLFGFAILPSMLRQRAATETFEVLPATDPAAAPADPAAVDPAATYYDPPAVDPAAAPATDTTAPPTP